MVLGGYSVVFKGLGLIQCYSGQIRWYLGQILGYFGENTMVIQWYILANRVIIGAKIVIFAANSEELSSIFGQIQWSLGKIQWYLGSNTVVFGANT